MKKLNEATKPNAVIPDAAVLAPTMLALLACPACLGELSAEAERLKCAGCGRVYPIVDGIPVLIAERGEVEDR